MDADLLVKELSFKAIRSSGAGGQHVNKTSSKIELTFNLEHSVALSKDEKERLQEKLHTKLTKEQLLILQCDTSRSQHKNKEIVIKRFLTLVKDGLKRPKRRKKTKPSKAAVKKRLTSKKKLAIKKNNRKKPHIE